MKRIPSILFGLALGVVFVPLLLRSTHVAPDFPIASRDVVSLGFSAPQAWSFRGGNGLGENVLFTLWSWPSDFLFGMGSSLGVDFSTLTTFIFLLPTVIVGLLGMRMLLTSLEIKGNGQIPGLLLFLLNTYFILLIDGGQLSLALAYAWTPIPYCYFIKSVRGSIRDKVIAALSFCLLSILDLRFAFLLILWLGLKFIFELIFSKGKTILHTALLWLKSGVVISLVWLALNIYWIIPLFSFKAESIPTSLVNSAQLSFLNFTQLFNALFLQQPNWPLNAFGRIGTPDWKFVLLFLPVIIITFKKKIGKELTFFLVLYTISVFLTKGANPPFSGIYEYLFVHVPGFSLFRDSSKFFTLVMVSSSVLISSTYLMLTDKWPAQKNKIMIAIILFLFALVSPVWKGQMTGMFSDPLNRTEFEKIAKAFSSDEQFGRVLWLPSRPPLGFSSITHPTLEALPLSEKRPFTIANVGTYERFNFLRESAYTQDLLTIAGISYVAYPFYDFRKQNVSSDQKLYYTNFSMQLDNADWVSQKLSAAPVGLYKTDGETKMFSVADNVYWVLGSEEIYEKINTSSSGTSILDYPLVFVEEKTGLMDLFKSLDFGTIVLNNKNKIDLAASVLDQEPSDPLNFIDSTSAPVWTVDLDSTDSWRSFIQEKYQLDNTDFANNNNTVVLEQPHDVILHNKDGNDVLLIRVLTGPKSGKIRLENNDLIDIDNDYGTVIGGINTDPISNRPEYKRARFHWLKIPISKDSRKVKISFQGELSAISNILFTNENALQQAYEFIEVKEKEKRLIDISSSSGKQVLPSVGSSSRVSWKMIKPTQYQVSISNQNGKKLVYFSQSYDKNWKAGMTSAIPLFSLVNGFVVSEAELNIHFAPQEYIYAPLLLAGFGLATLLLIFVTIKKT